jgi:predicted nucleotidyltransferase
MEVELKENKGISKGPYSAIIPAIPSMIFEKIEKDKIAKIYLFGSYAYGRPDKDSDVDICVVVGNKLKRSKIAVNIKLILMENNIIPSDLLVFKEDEFNDALNIRCIENTIARNGVLLYG